ncbi:MAG: MFS transporter [Alphaproteobacteria bacterium]
MQIRRPVWLQAASTPGATVFAILFTLESISRASLATLIPLQALSILGNARDVSVLFFAIGVAALMASFAIPLLIRRLKRRWVYSLGVAFLFLSPFLFVTATLFGQVMGMLVRVFGTACLGISLNLYIMDYIRKRDLVRSEPRKLLFAALPWTAGPYLGVYLHSQWGPWVAFGFSSAAAVVLFAYFWALRFAGDPAVAAAVRPPPNPLRNVRRFVNQPRLRLAWFLNFGRHAWWVTFFVYAPVFMVKTGQGELAGGLLVSAGTAMLLLMPFMSRLGGRYGIRRVMDGAYTACGVATAVAGFLFGAPLLAAGLLLVAAANAVALDAFGNIPFLRAVHAYERPEMTTVFATSRDIAELAMPALFAVLLTFFDLAAVFLAAGLLMFFFAGLARYLPRRM